jgi:hypothetical protein
MSLIASIEVTMLSPKLSAITLVSLIATAACGDDDTSPADAGSEMKKDAAAAEDSGSADHDSGTVEEVDGG